MFGLSRIANRVPYLQRLKNRLRTLSEERDALIHQRDLLEAERDELLMHCQVLERELIATRRARRGSFEGDEVLVEGPLEDPTPRAKRMRAEGDPRARLNAAYYTATGRADWDEQAYASSGKANVADEIL